MQKNELKFIDIDQLVPNSFNAQSQDDATFNTLVDNILDDGVISALTVVPIEDSKYLILSGEHRWRAARIAEEAQVPCLILTDAKFTQEDIQKFVTVRLNVLQGKLDADKFLNLYNPLVSKHGKAAVEKLMGFVNTDIVKKLAKQAKDNLKKLNPELLTPKIETALEEVKAVKDLQLIVQDIFHKSGDTIKQGYMVLSHGSQSHIYIQMTKKMKKTMDKLISFTKMQNKNINEVMEPFVSSFLAKQLEGLTGEEDNFDNTGKFDITEADPFKE